MLHLDHNCSHSIGIDTVEIDRFKNWHTYSLKSLRALYSQEEIDYCLSNSKKSAERFAVRLAAKEAFLKALNQLIPQQKLLILTICKAVSVSHKNNIPIILVDWNKLEHCTVLANSAHISISLTHSATIAIAIVLISIKQ